MAIKSIEKRSTILLTLSYAFFGAGFGLLSIFTILILNLEKFFAQVDTPEQAKIVSTIIILSLLFFLTLGIGYIISGIGLLKIKKWGKNIGISISIIWIVLFIFLMAISPSTRILGILIIIINAFLIYLLAFNDTINSIFH